VCVSEGLERESRAHSGVGRECVQREGDSVDGPSGGGTRTKCAAEGKAKEASVSDSRKDRMSRRPKGTSCGACAKRMKEERSEKEKR
jgi:hypothetical protein